MSRWIWMRRLVSLSILAAPLALAACSGGASLAAPPGFARLDESGPFTWRATTAQGVVLGARVEKNEPRGNLDFWADAVDQKLAVDGYKRDARSAVRSSGGLPGTMMKYERTDGGRTTRYLVTVYTTDDKVYLVEAAGDAERFDPVAGTVAQAELTLKPH